MIESLDHLVLTVASIPKTVAFYEALGMERQTFGEGRVALKFGSQKINLHERGKEFEPKAAKPTCGSADLCFLTRLPMRQIVETLAHAKIQLEEGPVRRTGAVHALMSVYVRDPDDNLVEISQELAS